MQDRGVLISILFGEIQKDGIRYGPVNYLDDDVTSLSRWRGIDTLPLPCIDESGEKCMQERAETGNDLMIREAE